MNPTTGGTNGTNVQDPLFNEGQLNAVSNTGALTPSGTLEGAEGGEYATMATEEAAMKERFEAAAGTKTRSRILKFATLGTVLVICFILVGIRQLHSSNTSQSAASSDASVRYHNISIPLADLASDSPALSVEQTQTLSINGQLNVNNSLVLAPAVKPSAAVAGQLYFDQTSKELSYYNGVSFVPLNQSTPVPLGVSSLGNATGALALGSGLAVNAGSLSNTGVLTLQGQAGNITLAAGPGIVVNGTTISSSGVLSLGGQGGDISVGSGLSISNNTVRNAGIISAVGAGTITVTNDGNGNITIDNNTSGGGGTVSSLGGTINKIAKFTGVQTIADSLISDNGTTVTVGGDLSVTGNVTLTNALPVTSGGTGGNTATSARTNLGAAKSGANSDITSLSGLTTALSVAQGGIGVGTLATNGVILGNGTSPLSSVVAGSANQCLVSTAGAPIWATCPGSGGVSSLNGGTGALTLNNASLSGSNITINDATTAAKGIASFNSTNFSVVAGAVNTIQNINTTAAPTFGQLTLTSSQAANPMFVVNNTNVAASGALLDLQLNGTSKFSVSPAGNITSAGTLNGQTISSSANFTGTLAVAGAINGQTISSAANFTGSVAIGTTLNVNTITPTGSLSVGANGQSFLLQGNASSTLTATNSGKTTTLAFQTPTANVTYSFPTAASNGAYDICTTIGNCAGVGGGVTTPGGTANTVAKFTGSGTIGNSSITDNGSTVTVGATLAVNTITPSSTLSIGATSQNMTLQGATVNLTSTASGITNSLTFATPSGSNKTITIPNATGTLAVSATGPLALDSAGNLTIANAKADGSTKGAASFNSTNFSDNGSGIINTVQNINTTAAPTFGQLTLTSSQAANAMMVINNTNVAATGNLIDLQLNGTSKFSVAPSGNTTVAGTLAVNTITPSSALTVGATGQSFTIQGSASSTITATGGGQVTTVGFTGTPTGAVTYNFDRAAAPNTYTICTTAGNCAGVGGGVTTPGGTANTIAKFTASGTIGNSSIADNGSTVTVGGTLAVNTITPSAALTVGATGQNLTLQGATVSLTATSGSITNSLTFATPSSSNKTVTVPNASGTVAVSASGPIVLDAAGNLTCPTCLTSGGGGGTAGVTSVNSLTGALTVANASGSGTTITINNAKADGSTKGIATFNSTNFSDNGSGVINTIQDIATTASPTFGQLTATSSQAANAMIVVNNTNAAATGNLIDLKLNGTSKFSVAPNGNTTIAGALAVNTITPSAALTVGATSQNLTLQGATVNLTATASGITNSLTFATPSGSNKTITIPNATGTVAVSASGPIALDAAGNLTCPTCLTSGGNGVVSLDGLTGTLTVSNSTGSGSTITINNAKADGSTKGIATFNSTNFSDNGSGVINTIQDISTTAAPTFGQLTVTSSQAANAMMVINNTNPAATGNLIDLQLNGNSKLTVAPNGNTTIAGTLTSGLINGQTISSSANFTGSVTVGTTLTVNTITPTSSLTVGATGQSFVLQGNGSSTITSRANGHTTTVGFTGGSPTTDPIYQFDSSAPTNTYTICTTAGNCTGGGVSGSGTSNRIAKFTATGSAIGDSSILDNGSSVTLNTNVNLVLQGGTASISSAQSASGSNGNDLSILAGAGNGTNKNGGNLILQGGAATGTGTNGVVAVKPPTNGYAFFIEQADGTQVLAYDTVFKKLSVNAGTGTQYELTFTHSYDSTIGVEDNPGTGNGANLILHGGNGGSSNNNGGSVILTGGNKSGSGTGGGVIVQNAADSAVAFQVQNAAGTTRIFAVDTTGSQIVLGKASTTSGKIAFYGSGSANALTLQGPTSPSTNTLTLPNETGTLCSTGSVCAGYAPGTGSGNYIQNQAASAQSASFFIQSANIGDITGALRMKSGQTADILQVQAVSGNPIFQISATANLSTFTDNIRIKGQDTSPAALVVQSNGNGIDTNLIADFQHSDGTSVVRIANDGGIYLGLTNSVAGAVHIATGTNTAFGAIDASGLTGLHTVHLPNEDGTLCVQNSTNCGFALVSGSTAYIQNATSVQTSANFNIRSSLSTNVTATIQGTTGQSADMLDLQTFNGSTSTTVAAFTASGALVLSGTGTTTYTTPGGANVPTKIGIPSYDAGNFGQILALGLPATNCTGGTSTSCTARVISVFDNRSLSHQPSIAVFAPNENDAIGFSWDGSNTIANIKTLDLGSGSTSGINLRSGNTGSGTAGNISVDTGSGTSGSPTVFLGATNATNVTVGHSGATIGITGAAIGVTGSTFTVTGAASSLTGPSGGASTALAVGTNAASNVGVKLQGASSQTADYLQVQDSTGANILHVDSAANLESLGYFDNGVGGIGQFQNLLQYSEQMDTGVWISTNESTHANDPAANPAPDGQTTGDLVGTVSAGGTLAQTSTTAIANNTSYTFSFWAKYSGGGTQLLTAGITGSTGGTAVLKNFTATSTWQRFWLTLNTGASGYTGNVQVIIYPGGAGSGSIGVWGTQLVVGSTPQVYVRTTNGTIGANQGVVSNGALWTNALNASDVPLVVQGAVSQSADLLRVQSSTGSILARVDQNGGITAAGLTLGPSPGSGSLLTNNGATVNSTLALGDFATGGSIGSAASTVDIYTSISVAQATAGQTLTLPTPTASTTYGRMLYLSNVGTTSFTVGGFPLKNGATASFIWSNTNGGASWQYAGVDGASILNQNATVQTANFNISGTGSIGTSLTVPTLQSPASTALTITGNAASTWSTNAGLLTVSGGGGVTINSASGTTSSAIIIQSGNASAGAAGNVTIDTGTSTSGTPTVNIATANAKAVTIGNATTNIATTINGTALIKPTSGHDSTTAFQVQNAAGTTPVFDVDTSNTRVGIGNNTPGRTLDVNINNSTVNALPLRVTQAGSGDVGIELANPGKNFYAGIDGTDGVFKITSATAANGTFNLGTQSVPGSGDNNPNGTQAAPITTVTGGSLSSISVYISSVAASPNNHIQVGIYTNASGNPGTLLASSALVAATTGWNTIPVSSVTLANSTSYWLALSEDGATTFATNTNSGPVDSTNYDTSGAAYPLPGSAGNPPVYATTGNSKDVMSIYATIATSGATDNFGGTPLFRLSDAGQLALQNSVNTTTAFQVQNAAGSGLLTVDTANNQIVIGASAGSGTVLLNNGATINSTLALGNFATGGSIGSAASTVDVYTSISVAQTTAGQTLTLPNPTANTTYGRMLYLSNIGTNSFTIGGFPLKNGATATFIWSNTNGGASWQYAGVDGASILNQTSTTQTAGFNISGTGTIGTSLTVPTLQSAASTALTITGNAASTWSTSAGLLTVQGGGGVSITSAAGTTSSAITIQSGNASGGASGNVTIDTGTSTSGTPTVNIATANAKAVTIGNTTTNIATTINGTVLVKPTSGNDSTTALQMQNAAGSTILTGDTTNKRISIDASYAAMSTPTGLSVSAAQSGGSLTATTTYFYKVTAIDSAGGETTPSTEASGATTSSNKTLPVSWTAVAGASGYRVYRSTTSGSEVYLTTVLTNSFTDSGAITTGSATPPATTTAYVSTNNSNGSLQLTVGGNGTPAGQVYVSGIVPAGPLTSVTGTGTCGSSSCAMAVQGRYAYTAGSNFVIFDISNPAAPVKMNTAISLSDDTTSIAVQGRYVYITLFSGTLKIYDVSNPTSPSLTSTTTLATFARGGIVVQGRYAYVTNDNSLDLYDVSNPASPTKVSSVTTSAGNYYLAVQGRYAYMTSQGDNKLRIIDYTNPASPTIVSTTSVSNIPQHIVVQGRYLYLAGYGTNSLVIYDISNPSTPVQVGSLGSLTGIINMSVQGRYAYVVGTAASMYTVDISNPTKPFLVGTTTTTTTSPYNIVVQGRYGYILYGNSANSPLDIYDLGGAYSQSLEAGSIETSNISVNQNLSVNLGATISGGLIVGQSTELNGNLGVSGAVALQNTSNTAGELQVLNSSNTAAISVNTNNNSVGIGGLTNPGALTMGTTSGGSLTTGTTYYYKVTALDSAGNETLPSPENSRTATTPNLTVTVSWTAIPGATSYRVYRGTAAGAESVYYTTTTNSFSDTGAASTGGTPPTVNAAAAFRASATNVTFQNTTDSTSAFQIQNAAGSTFFTADTTDQQVIITSDNTYTSDQSLGTNALNIARTPTVNATTGSLAFDAANGVTSACTSSGNTMTLSHTVGTGSNRFIILYVGITSTGGTAGVSSVTYNGVAMTQIGTFNSNGGLSHGFIYGLKNPATGTHSFQFTETYSGTSSCGVYYGSTSWTNVDQTNPYSNFTSANGVSGTPSVTISSAAGNTVVDMLFPASSFTAAGGQTARLSGGFIATSKAGAASTTMSYTGSSADWGLGAVSLNQAATTALTVTGAAANITSNCNVTAGTCVDTSNVISVSQQYASASGTVLNVNTVGTGSLLGLQNNGTNVLSVSNTGAILGKNSADSTSAFQIQNNAGATVLNVDTTNQRVSIGTGGTAVGQLYVPGLIPSGTTGSVSTTENGYYVLTQGRYAYVLTSSKLRIFDVTRPNSMTSLGSVALTNPTDMVIQGKYAYVVGNGNIYIVDISNPSSPSLVSTTNYFSTTLSDIYVQGRYLFGVSTLDNIVSYDISNPATPHSLGSLSLGTSTPYNVVVQGKYAYVTTSDTFYVINVSDPTNMTQAGSLATSTSYQLVVQGRYAYIESNSGGNIQAIDISNPASPTSANTLALSSNATELAINQRYLYVGLNTPNGIRVIDISNPTSMTAVGTLSTGGTIKGLAVLGRYLYAADYTNSNLLSYDFGGEYVQSLEAGNIETGNITISDQLTAAGSASFQGSTAFGQSVNIGGDLGVSGNILFQSKTNSSTSFQIQNSTGTALFTADTSGMAITIGGSGNTVTLSAANGLVAAGTARHTKTILLTPEFAGGVLDAQNDASCSSAFNGTMTSGYDNTNRMNYYNWTSAQGSAQCYDVVVQVPIPSDFSAWSGNPDIEMQKDSTGTAAYALQITPSSGSDANYGSFAAGNTITTSWSNMANNPLSGTYTAGNYLTIRVRMTSTSGANVKLGNIKLQYLSTF